MGSFVICIASLEAGVLIAWWASGFEPAYLLGGFSTKAFSRSDPESKKAVQMLDN